jgi:NhaA family Na+:H+ antiporter
MAIKKSNSVGGAKSPKQKPLIGPPAIDPTSKEIAAEGFLKPFTEFTHNAAAGGLVLMVATLVALFWANSRWGLGYEHLVHEKFGLIFGERLFVHDLHYWINDGLMAIFFFVVGLEIKREFLVGELSQIKKAMLPIGAAVGGMVAPAAVFAALNMGDSVALRGAAIPMATDIAFAVGIMALLGKRVPEGLKVFLVALAIVDDLGAVVVIAIFYTAQIYWIYLAFAAGVTGLLVLANRFGIRSALVYGLLSAILWYCFLMSGIHATLAGVVAAMTVPTRVRLDPRRLPVVLRGLGEKLKLQTDKHGVMSEGMLNSGQFKTLAEMRNAVVQAKSPLQRFEHALHPWVTFAIIPVFALFNAGVVVNSEALQALIHFDPRAIEPGIALGLIAGKQLGVFVASFIMVKAGLAALPRGVGWFEIYGAAWLTGIGFTMSLFISGLAYGGLPPAMAIQLQTEAKMGIMAGSLVSGVVGFLILFLWASNDPEEWEKKSAAKVVANIKAE